MKKHYSVIIFSSLRGIPRKFNISARTIKAGAIVGGVLILAFSYLTYYYATTYHLRDNLQGLLAEKKTLEDKNARYVSEMEKLHASQSVIDERVGRLATLVGVESLPDASTVGGAGGFTEVDRTNLDPAEKLMTEIKEKHSLFEHNLEEVEKIYIEKKHLLSYVPSVWPTDGIITAGYGWRRDPFTGKPEFHSAIDISARTGTPIRAPADGVVSEVGYSPGYGNTLVISHGYGYVTRYAHLHKYNTKAGARVKRGDVIGYVGSTGRSTGPHLHYEIIVNQKLVDARKFVVEEARRF